MNSREFRFLGALSSGQGGWGGSVGFQVWGVKGPKQQNSTLCKTMPQAAGKKALEMNIQTCHMACGENTLTLYSIWLIQLSIWDALLFTTVPKSKGMYFSEEKLFPNQTYCHSSISIVAKPLNWQDIRLIRKKRRGACSNFCVLCLLKPTPDICYLQYLQPKTIGDAISLFYHCSRKIYY